MFELICEPKFHHCQALPGSCLFKDMTRSNVTPADGLLSD